MHECLYNKELVCNKEFIEYALLLKLQIKQERSSKLPGCLHDASIFEYNQIT